MACNLSTITEDITLDCSDVPVGGVISAYIVRYDNITDFVEAGGEITDITLTGVVNLEFNNKDSFSNFTDTKTVDDAGVVTAVPTLTLEFPKMTLAKRNAIEKLTQAGSEVVAFVETSAGEYHALGMDFGLWGSGANGQSGAGRTEKNKYELILEGEETNLSRFMTEAAWALVMAANV